MNEGSGETETREPAAGETDYDRHAHTFAPLAPDVAISGFDVNRASLHIDPDSDTGEVETHVQWRIAGFSGPQGMRPHMLVIGDLQARQGGWFAGCTVVAHVDFRREDLKPSEEENDVVDA